MADPIPDPAAEAAPEHPRLQRVLAALAAAAIFLTRLPLTVPGPVDASLFGRAMGWFWSDFVQILHRLGGGF